MSSTPPPSPRPGARATRWLAPLALVPLLLAACSDRLPSGLIVPWSSAELSAVFDLTELGASLSVDAERGTLMLSGRPLPAEVIEALPHLSMGRTHNLLRFSDDLLEAIDGDVRFALTHAAPSELRAYLSDYGLTMGDLQRAWRDQGEVGWGALQQVVAQLDASSGLQALQAGSALSAGQRLLADLGLAGRP